jgi:3',5'-cyclic-AMP phosphodiesterase
VGGTQRTLRCGAALGPGPRAVRERWDAARWALRVVRVLSNRSGREWLCQCEPPRRHLRGTEMLIAHLSDIHVGGSRYRQDLLETAIAEVNSVEPDLVVIAGDITDEGYPDQYPVAKTELAALKCRNVVMVPGNHDARNVGYLGFEDTFGGRDTATRLDLAGLDVAVVAVDSSKPDLDTGEIGREHYGWIHEGFEGPADLRVFVCHHHLLPIPGTGRERNQVLDAGDVLSVLRQAEVDVVLAGHRHVPYVWPVGGMLLIHSGTASTLRTRGFPHPAYNLVHVKDGRISVTLHVPGGERQSLGSYPRDWPAELSARHSDPFVRPQRGTSLADG